MKRFALIVPLILLLGCSTPRTISRAELERVQGQWQERKLSTWYYVGSRNGFHHFNHQNLGGDQKEFRISEREFPWRNEFPLTRNRSHWRKLNWGFHDLKSLDVGDCLVLELDIGHSLPWRRTIDAEGYFPAYMNIKVKVVGMTVTEARDAIASEYVQRNILRAPLDLAVLRCEDYDRERLEIERRVKAAKEKK